MAIQIKLRRDTGANWTTNDPVLGQGEVGIELDSSPVSFKIGDGTSAWSALSYFAGSVTETDPIVGAITGLVKADGAGNISAAVADTDYLTPSTAASTYQPAFTVLDGGAADTVF